MTIWLDISSRIRQIEKKSGFFNHANKMKTNARDRDVTSCDDFQRAVDASAGIDWNNQITRRRFLKRTGGATAATMLALHGMKVQILAGVSYQFNVFTIQYDPSCPDIPINGLTKNKTANDLVVEAKLYVETFIDGEWEQSEAGDKADKFRFRLIISCEETEAEGGKITIAHIIETLSIKDNNPGPPTIDVVRTGQWWSVDEIDGDTIVAENHIVQLSSVDPNCKITVKDIRGGKNFTQTPSPPSISGSGLVDFKLDTDSYLESVITGLSTWEFKFNIVEE